MVQLAQPRTEAKVTGIPTSGLLLIVGHPKSGKTWFASSFPDSLVVELEQAGADRVKWGRIQEDDAWDLDKFGQVMEAALADDSVKTIVIDTIDQLAKLFQDDIAKGAGLEHIQQPKVGVDSRALWGEFGARVKSLTDNLKRCGKLVILVAHCKSPEKDNEGRVITPAGINVSGQGGAYIAAQAEVVGFVGVRVVAGKAQHYVTFKAPSDLAIWRSRIEELHDREIVLDKQDPYGSFAKAFAPAAGAEGKAAGKAGAKGGKK